MADTDTFQFKNEQDEEQTIAEKDLVAVLPGSPDSLSTVIYVQQDGTDDTAPPKVKIVKGNAASTVQPPDTSDSETHIIISTGSGTNKATAFYDEAVKSVLETLFPKGHANFLIHNTESASTIE